MESRESHDLIIVNNFPWPLSVDHTTSGQEAKERRGTNLVPLAVVQVRDGNGLAQTGSTNLENHAWVHMLV